MRTVAAAWGERVVCTGEASLPDRLGRPDYAVHRGGLLAGYVELKAPGTGADAARFRGRDRAQFRRFSAIPNVVYSDGNEWALYRGGERVGRIVRLAGDVAGEGRQAVGAEDARALEPLLRDFLSWEPVLPLDRGGRLDLGGFAGLLAPLCRLLRDDVAEALGDAGSPLVQLAGDWRQLLFPDATDEQFADAYAQTVAFALLLGRSEGADPPDPGPGGGGAGRAAQPAVAGVAGADRPWGARGDGGIAGPAAACGVGGAGGGVGGAARPVAVLLRGLSGCV